MSYQENKLKEIADAIREKKGTTETISANSFVTEIKSIQTKENLDTELNDLDTSLDDLETFVDGMEEGGGGTASGLPIELSTDEEMASVLTDENIGKVYKFVGTSETYKTNKIYIIKEA